jgi:hypothetical protein
MLYRAASQVSKITPKLGHDVDSLHSASLGEVSHEQVLHEQVYHKQVNDICCRT